MKGRGQDTGSNGNMVQDEAAGRKEASRGIVT